MWQVSCIFGKPEKKSRFLCSTIGNEIYWITFTDDYSKTGVTDRIKLVPKSADAGCISMSTARQASVLFKIQAPNVLFNILLYEKIQWRWKVSHFPTVKNNIL